MGFTSDETISRTAGRSYGQTAEGFQGSDSIHGQIKTDGSKSDVRCLIAARLEDFLDDYADRPEAYSEEWNPSALKICRRIVNSVFTQN